MSSNVTKEIQDSVSSLYIAFFGRAPDARGFGYWAKEMADGVSPYTIASNFALSNEWISNYDGLTPTEQVTLFYNNVFNRAPDAPGLKYWVAEIDGGLDFSAVAYQIIWAAKLGGAGVDPADNALVLNKIAVAEYFALDLKSNDLTVAATAFNGVTQDVATVAAAEARLDAAVNPAATYTLTTGADSFTGTDSGDIFAGQVTSNGQLTWQSWDTLNGGAGTDTLNADMNANVVSMANVSSVENLNLNVAGATTTLNANGASFIQNIDINNAATVGFAINSLGSLPAVALQGAGATTLDFTAAALADAGQTLNVTAQGMTGGGLTLTDTGSNALETVSITSSGSANNVGGLTTTNLGVTTLNISGAQNINLGAITDTTAGGATLRTVNASTLTGNLTLIAANNSTVTGGEGNDSITAGGGFLNSFTGGAGNDTFVMGANLNANSTIAGGDGALDVLSADGTTLDNFTATAPTTNVSGIESVTVTTDGITGANVLRLSAIQAGIADVNLQSGTLLAPVGNTGTIVFDGGVAANIDVGSATARDSMGGAIVSVAGSATTDTLTIDNDTVAENLFDDGTGVAAGLTVRGVETLTIDGTTTGAAAAAQAATTITMTPTTGGTSTLNLIGNNSFSATGIITAGAINASGLGTQATGVAASLTMAAVANTATTIIGGGGADTLRANAVTATATSIDGGAGNDTIVGFGTANDTLLGGAGADTITAAAGNDTINAGEGNDLVIMAGNLTAADTVAGGDGTDTLSVDLAVTAATASNVSAFEVLRATTAIAQDMGVLSAANSVTSFQDYSGGASSLTNTSAGFNSVVVGVTTNGGTFASSRLIDGTADTITISREQVGAKVGTASGYTTTTLNDEEIININSTDGDTGNDDALTIGTAAGTGLLAADATTITVTGNDSVSIVLGTNGFGTDGGTTTIDMTGVTSDTLPLIATFNGSASSTATGVKMSISGSTTEDNVLLGGGNADTITGGAGADTITGNAGQDVLSGAAGADDYVYLALTDGGNNTTGGSGAFVTAGDSITTFTSGTDQIDVQLVATATGVANLAAGANWNFGATNGAVYLTGAAFDYQAGVSTAGDILTVINTHLGAGGVTTLAGTDVGVVAILDNQGTAATTDDLVNVYGVTAGAILTGVALTGAASVTLLATVTTATFSATTDFIA